MEISNDSLINKNIALNKSNEVIEIRKKNANSKLNEKINKINEESLHLSFELAKTQNLFNKSKDNLIASKEIND